MKLYIDYLVKWLQEKVKETNTSGLIVGVSGGIDSAVVANLIKLAFPDNSIGLIMPCYSSKNDVEDALIVVNDTKLDYRIINLDKTFDTIIEEIKNNNIEESNRFKLAKGNAKARLRMITLYTIAQNYNYLVCGTDNAIEWYTGYFTKYGDGGVDIAPLIHLSKSQVYEMAKELNVADAIINKAPSAGLIDNRSDEEELQVTYAQIERYLSNQEVSIKAKERIEFLHKVSEHKRNIVASPLKKVSDFK